MLAFKASTELRSRARKLLTQSHVADEAHGASGRTRRMTAGAWPRANSGEEACERTNDVHKTESMLWLVIALDQGVPMRTKPASGEQGFIANGTRSACAGALDDLADERGGLDSVAGGVGARACKGAMVARRPEMAPECPEMIESATGNASSLSDLNSKSLISLQFAFSGLEENCNDTNMLAIRDTPSPTGCWAPETLEPQDMGVVGCCASPSGPQAAGGIWRKGEREKKFSPSLCATP